MHDVLLLEVIATIANVFLKLLFMASCQSESFSDTNLITFTVMTSSKGHVPTVKPII